MNGKKPIDYSQIGINKLMGSMGDISYLVGDHIKETLAKVFEGLKKGIMPKQALNLGPETIEALYTQAYTMYNQGKYKEASFLFQLLMMLDPTVPKHVLGCAACLHRMELFEKAAQLYLLCGTLEPTNPLPHFHASDCYIKLKALDLAVFSLKNAISVAKDNPEYAVVKERATMMLQTIDAEIKAQKESKGKETKEESGQ